MGNDSYPGELTYTAGKFRQCWYRRLLSFLGSSSKMPSRPLARLSRSLRSYSQITARAAASAVPNMTQTTWTMEDSIIQKRASQASAIPAAWKLPTVPPAETGFNALDFIRNFPILSPEETEITETTDAKVLLDKLATGELSSVKVTTAFCKRAAIAHQLTNCCTELFFDEALVAAQHADAYLAKTGRTLGPLHGLPISMKDLFRIKGQDSTIGMLVREHE